MLNFMRITLQEHAGSAAKIASNNPLKNSSFNYLTFNINLQFRSILKSNLNKEDLYAQKRPTTKRSLEPAPANS